LGCFLAGKGVFFLGPLNTTMQTTPRLIPLPLYTQVLIAVACGALLGVVFGQESYLGGLRNEDLGGLGLLLVTLLKTLAGRVGDS